MSDPSEIGSDAVSEDWLVTYADAITILMAFFVMMFSISEPSPEKFDEVAGGILEELEGKNAAKAEALLVIAAEMQETVDNFEENDSASMDSSDKGMTFNFKSNSMFKGGSAVVVPEAEASLDHVAQMVSLMGITNYSVEVEGHTDDVPIKTKQFPSNWELSAARAAAVVRWLISRGVDPERLRAVGYGDTKPLSPNLNDEGEGIKENREENRRIVIKIER
ncbi:MAG: flagellar motor protein MotB [Alphaproteobacteria bacterium]|nr:flagellar motor protein MotB [Alphaproteobacteria bacterium]MBT4020180.1 flagellar motor protein MotB [Alphaproteobacteria bacterium]MBT4964633.1 flagellar motor protein MotB [Alphaproteobacteria bacterium]MBT5159288.1 flagellar motor protein MotB [Alphaproteobacteria bacterium]MBT5918505.1 flagellar motor protein MotB [Alphaproteobacteria bacterium]